MDEVGRDWRAWHEAYDADTPLRRRLGVVQERIRVALDGMRPGLIRVVSFCAGEGRDLLGVLADHARAGDVRARLVELDDELAARARRAVPSGTHVEVVCADASSTDAFAGAIPADLVLTCGVFGNITDDDIERTIRTLPSLCAPNAVVIWTRHRRPPDRTVDMRRWFEDAGFEDNGMVSPSDELFGVGVHTYRGEQVAFAPGRRMFSFIGYDNLR
jgi:hypothetical protein